MAIAISSAIFLLLHGPFSPFSTRKRMHKMQQLLFHSMCTILRDAQAIFGIGYNANVRITKCRMKSQVYNRWTTKSDHNCHWWRMGEGQSKKPETLGTNLMENYLFWNKCSSHIHDTRTHTCRFKLRTIWKSTDGLLDICIIALWNGEDNAKTIMCNVLSIMSILLDFSTSALSIE